MRPLPRLSPSAALLLAVPGVVMAIWGILFGAGGLAPGAAVLIAAGTTLPAAVAIGLIAAGRWPYTRPSRAALMACGGTFAFAAIAALSALWSLSPQRSLNDAIMAAGYAAAVTLGIILGPLLPRPGVTFATGITALATTASAWALVARSFEVTTGVQFTPRLSGTLSLPNALAILSLAGLFGGLALAAHRTSRLRLLGGAVASVNAIALVLTSSRSGLGLALIGIVAMQLVLPAAPRMRLVGLFAIVPAVVFGFRIATWDAFVATQKSVAAAGWELAVIALACTVLGAAIAALAPRAVAGAQPAGPVGRASRRTVLAAGAVVLLLAIALVVRSGGPVQTIEDIRAGFTGPVGQSGVRIGIGSNLRDHWWGTAWSGFEARPLIGDGAGTFRLLEQTTRSPAYTTDSTHNTILEVLAGTGLLGGIAFGISAAGLLAIAIGAIRRARPGDGVGVAVVSLGSLAFLAQGLVDVDWDLAAQAVIVFASLGAIAPIRHTATRPGPWTRAAGATSCILLVIAGLFGVAFWLGARDAERSTAVADDPPRALELAASAHRWAPLAVEPLLAEADARELLGDPAGSERALRKAIAREPANYEAWLYLGTYLAFSWGREAEGRAALERANALSGGDPSVLTLLESLPPPP